MQNWRLHTFHFGAALILVMLLVMAASGQVFSAVADSCSVHSTDQPVIQNAGELQFGKVLLRTILSLFLVILFLIAFLFGLKWLQNQTRASVNRMHNLSVQDSVSLGPKKQLFLIQVVDRMLLVGSSENNISLLLELTDDEKQKLQDKKSGNQHTFSKTLANQIAKLGGAHKS